MKQVQMPETFMNRVAELVIGIKDESMAAEEVKALADEIFKLLCEKADRVKARDNYTATH